VFEVCNEEYVVPHVSFASFVITDFNKLIFVGVEKIDSRFDSNANGRFAGAYRLVKVVNLI